MKRLILLISSIMLLNICMAQVPGYIGRRSPISLDINIFPAIRFSKLAKGILPVNLRWGLSMEHVLSRRFALGASISNIRTIASYESDAVLNQIAGDALIRGVTFGVGFKMYNFKRIGNIAPIGPFQQLELLFLNYRMTDLDRNFFEDGRSYLGSFKDIGLSFNLGTQRVFQEHFTYHLGVKVGVALGAFRGKTDIDRHLIEIATDRLQGYYFLNINAGIGVLLF